MLPDFDDIDLPKDVGGRPEVVIDYAVVERAASIGCSKEEISAVLGIARSTLYLHMETDLEIQAAIDRGQDGGKATLRRLQWKGAEDGNPTMLIWLGKQLLGQRDVQSNQHLDKDGKPTDPPSHTVIRLVG